MATSFIGYQAKGFWCSDTDLESWLAFAVLELDTYRPLQGWLQEVYQAWSFYSKVGITGAIDLELDQFICSEERKTWLLAFIHQVENQLNQLGDTIPCGLLNPLLPPGTYWVEDPPTVWLTIVGRRIQQLVEGNMLTDESSPLDYLQLSAKRRLE